MDCPNDRYVNDEAICHAVVSMLARIGIRVKLNAQPKAKYFPKCCRQGSTAVSTFWAGPRTASIPGTRYTTSTAVRGSTARARFGPRVPVAGFRTASSTSAAIATPRWDALAARILSETEKAVRDRLIRDAWSKTIDDIAYIPLHQQALAWGVREHVALAQRPDNQFAWQYVRLE